MADTRKKKTDKGEHAYTLIGTRIIDMLIVGP